MKTLILSISVSFVSFCSFAQGSLNFANAGVGVNAPISDDPYYFGNARLAGNAFWAQLWWGAAGTTDSATLTAIGNPVNFLSGAQAGYFTGGTITFPTVPGGTHVIVQVRAWDAAHGNTWSAVMSSGVPGARVGWSQLIDVGLTQPPTTPPNIVGLQGFNIIIGPEPSSLSLVVVGLTFVVMQRRQRSSPKQKTQNA